MRDCRKDLEHDWQKVWYELNIGEGYPKVAPKNKEIEPELQSDDLRANMRDLQKLAVLSMAYWDASDVNKCINIGLTCWKKDRNSFVGHPIDDNASLTREEHVNASA